MTAHSPASQAETLSSLQRLSRLTPRDAAVWRRLGYAHLSHGEWEAAAAGYRSSIELEPECARAHNNLGIALCEEGEIEAGLESYRRALALKPGSVPVLAARGDALASLQRLDEALAAYESGLQRDPRDIRLLGNAARVLLELRQPLRALDYRERASILNLLCRFEDSLECSQANLGCYYEPYALSPAAVDLRRWGIDSRRTLFVCAGMPFKYAPRHDHVFPEIARRMSNCQFDLVAHTSEEYVALAVRLATDEDFRQDVRRRMESGKGRLFRDGAAIDSFAEFLTGLNSRPTPASGSAPP
jgi:tetratricopeptide (TPR) repeat protein